jgi:hypothetical protein
VAATSPKKTTGSSKNHGKTGGKLTPISREQWDRLVDAWEKYEDRSDRLAAVVKATGISRATCHRAYVAGLGASFSATPIKDLLIAKRAQKMSVSTVLMAAKSSGLDAPLTPEELAALDATFEGTDLDKLRAAVRLSVQQEIAIVDGQRRASVKLLASQGKLAQLLEDRADAALKKYGATRDADGKLVLPDVLPLPEEVRALEGLLRLLRAVESFGKVAIEMERIRIGDPEALRRRLDSVTGSELGGAGKAAASPEEAADDVAEEPAIPAEEAGAAEEWLGIGLRVIEGGRSTSAARQASAPADPGEDAASTAAQEGLLEEDPSEAEDSGGAA